MRGAVLVAVGGNFEGRRAKEALGLYVQAVVKYLGHFVYLAEELNVSNAEKIQEIKSLFKENCKELEVEVDFE